MIVLVLESFSTYSPHINHSGQDSLTKIIFRAPISRSGHEARSNKKQQYKSGRYKMQTADCRPCTKCRLGTKCRLQTGYKMQNENVYFFLVLNVQGYTHTDLRICALYCYWLTWGTAPQTHTHTNKKDTACLITSTHPTSSQHNLFSNSHHDECTSFLNTQLRKNKIKFNPKVLKVHIKRI